MEEEDKKKKNCSQDQDPNSLKAAAMKSRKDENGTCTNKKEDLESTKAEMGEVIEENKRLKSNLDQIMKDYQSLQMRFHEFTRTQQEDPKNLPIEPETTTRQTEEDTHELSLSLGRNPSLDSKSKNEFVARAQEALKERSSSGLSLALDYKNEATDTPLAHNSSAEDSLEESKDEAGGSWPPSKGLKVVKSGGRDEDVVQQPPAKKARVSVRARCDTPTMNDGCQWRKYGQKIAKGNPCPRAYYRCTVAPSCPVRKQVQRCADDMSILITTYEGTHNHPLPISATAMASTTSAAAYMLISGSSTSTNMGIGSSTTSTTTSANLPTNSNSNLPGLNFNNSNTPRPLYLPNSSFSPSPSQPTITLDLTIPSASSSSASSSQYSNLSSTSFASRTFPTSTNLTFNSLDMSNSNPNGTNLPMSWPPSGPFSYNKTQMGPTLGNQESFYQTLFQKFIPNHNPNPNPNPNLISASNPSNKQQSMDTIAAAAKAITSDPSFQSILTAALSSIMSANNNENKNSGILSSLLPFSGSSKSTSSSHEDSRDNTN